MSNPRHHLSYEHHYHTCRLQGVAPLTLAQFLAVAVQAARCGPHGKPANLERRK
jgi:hypothetical protein